MKRPKKSLGFVDTGLDQIEVFGWEASEFGLAKHGSGKVIAWTYELRRPPTEDSLRMLARELNEHWMDVEYSDDDPHIPSMVVGLSVDILKALQEIERGDWKTVASLCLKIGVEWTRLRLSVAEPIAKRGKKDAADRAKPRKRDGQWKRWLKDFDPEGSKPWSTIKTAAEKDKSFGPEKSAQRISNLKSLWCAWDRRRKKNQR